MIINFRTCEINTHKLVQQQREKIKIDYYLKRSVCPLITSTKMTCRRWRFSIGHRRKQGEKKKKFVGIVYFNLCCVYCNYSLYFLKLFYLKIY